MFDYNAPDTRGGAGRGAGSVFFSVVKSLFVIALLCGAGWIVVRWLSRKQFVGEVHSDAFRVIARHSVAAGRSLCVVRVIDSYSVLAFSESGVSVVKEITDRGELEKVKAMERELPAGTDRPPDFAETLTQALKSTGQAFSGGEGKGRSADKILAFLRKQKERLSGMNGGKQP
jgi:flagellar biogenesis protein FliO